jgi:hypothetical protein
VTQNHPAADETRLRLHWGDGVVALVVFLMVRIMVRGIEFTHWCAMAVYRLPTDS